MSYSYGQNDSEIWYLRDEIERLRQREIERDQQEQDECDIRRNEIRDAAEYSRRSASDWRSALEKQAFLYRRESKSNSLHPEILAEPFYEGVDDFGISAEACRRGVEIWDEIANSKAEQIQQLELQLQTLKDSLRLEVAQKLRQEFSQRPGAKHVEVLVISGLEKGGHPEEWLNW